MLSAWLPFSLSCCYFSLFSLARIHYLCFFFFFFSLVLPLQRPGCLLVFLIAVLLSITVHFVTGHRFNCLFCHTKIA
ncbi:hypothetical protein GGI43DRAFT_402298 [Trichoderma evansii]